MTAPGGEPCPAEAPEQESTAAAPLTEGDEVMARSDGGLSPKLLVAVVVALLVGAAMGAAARQPSVSAAETRAADAEADRDRADKRVDRLEQDVARMQSTLTSVLAERDATEAYDSSDGSNNLLLEALCQAQYDVDECIYDSRYDRWVPEAAARP